MKIQKIIAIIGMLILFSIPTVSAQLNGYTRELDCTIKGGSIAQTNAQIPFYIYRMEGNTSGNSVYLSDINCDFSDLKFTSTSDVKYDYWIENVSSNCALVWVEIPYIPASPETFTVRIQYNNPCGVSESNGENTFDFFDNAGNTVWNKLGVVIEPDDGYNVAIEGSILYEDNAQILTGTVFKNWYRLYNDETGASALGYAESYNGVDWVKYGPVLTTGELMWCPYVFRINETTMGLYVHADWDYYDFWVSTNNGISWVKVKDNALTVGSSGEWDDDALGNIHVWCESPTDWRMIYEAKGETGGYWKIGYATSSNGLTWTKHGSNPVLTDTGMCGGQFIQKIGDRYYMWYQFSTTTAGTPTDTARAYSDDLVTWTKEGSTFYRSETYEGFGNSEGQVADSSIVEVDDKLYMFYDCVVDQVCPPDQTIALAVCDMTFQEIVTTTEDRDTSIGWADNWTFTGTTAIATRQNGYYTFYPSNSATYTIASNFTISDPFHYRTHAKINDRTIIGGSTIGMRNKIINDINPIIFWHNACDSYIRCANNDIFSTVDSNADTSANVYDIYATTSSVSFMLNDIMMVNSPVSSKIPNYPMSMYFVDTNDASCSVFVDWVFVGKPILISYQNAVWKKVNSDDPELAPTEININRFERHGSI